MPHFVVGTPGEDKIRLAYPNWLEADMAACVRDGEVYVEVPVLGPGRITDTDPPAFVLDDRSLQNARAAKVHELRCEAEKRLNLWNNLQVDDTSTGRMTSWSIRASLCLQTGEPFTLPYWILADNTTREFAGAADFLTFVGAALEYKTQAVLHNSALKRSVEESVSIEELDAIDLSAGWPTQP